jgi:hypothetical protein
VNVESIVQALLEEDPRILDPGREEEVALVEIALRRARWRAPGNQMSGALMDAVHYELERLMLREIGPPAPSPVYGDL